MPFNENRAEEAVKFISLLQHTKGRWAKQPFILEPWQDKIVRDVFGTVTKDGKRQYRTVYVEVPRKNGKTALAAALALYMLFIESQNDTEAEVYSAASDRDQASLVFNQAASMIRSNNTLAKKCHVVDSTKRIVFHKTNSFYRAIPADAASAHGYNASCIIVDELHTQAKRDLVDTLITSQGAREEPLTIFLTTAGYDKNSICYEYHDYAKSILKGTIKDETFYPVIYAADEGDDWQSIKTWRKSNPNLGITINEDFLKQEARKAAQVPAYQNTFKRLYLNIWTQQHSRWIDLNLWNEQAGMVDEDKLKGRTCYGGLDLASVSDMVAWVIVFPGEKDPEHMEVVSRFWCPENRIYSSNNKYRDQYQEWAKKGLLKTTPGDYIDYHAVRKQILDDAKKFNLKDMNVDRLFQAHQLAGELEDEGITVLGMGQGFLSMAKPMKDLERLLLARKIEHGGNPVLRWMADNVSVKQDSAGNLKPDKASSQGKIDGIMALLMAIDRAIRHQKKSVYEDRGVRSV